MRKSGLYLVLCLVCIVLLASVSTSAHITRAIGDDEFLVIVGLVNEPPFTEERNGLDLAVRRVDTGDPVSNLEQTLFAEIIAPDGEAKRELDIRAVHGEPGFYTADVVLTEPGVYHIRVWGYVHTVSFDETFETSYVEQFATLRFPNE